MKTVEIRVRPVTRHVVTRFESENNPGGRSCVGSSVMGEFQNAGDADHAALAFKAAEPHARVVTSDGIVHEAVAAEWVITKVKTFDVANEVYFASTEAEAIKTRDAQEAATGTEWACFSRPKAARHF